MSIFSLIPSSPPTPPGVTPQRCRGWCRWCSLTSEAIGHLVFPSWHLQAGALCFQQCPARRGVGWVLLGGCCGVGGCVSAPR